MLGRLAMRKWFGVVLLGLGAFLLVAGVLAVAWAPGAVKKTPLDVNTVTHLDGTVKKLNAATGELEENPVKVESITKADSDASDDDTVVFVQTSCVVIDVDDAPNCVDGDDERLVSADSDVFAADRVTAVAVPDYPGLPADAVPHEGLVNKWPFDSEKKDYEYWDGTVGQAVPAVYDRTETLLGVECYVYTLDITDAQIEIADGINGTYDIHEEFYVEPKTGAIQQQTQDQQRYLEDGTQVLDLKIGFTEEQQQQFADDADSNTLMLDMVTMWVPLVGLAGGALCVLAGVLLLLSVRRNTRNGSGEPTSRHASLSNN
jgi:Porin PorA